MQQKPWQSHTFKLDIKVDGLTYQECGSTKIFKISNCFDIFSITPKIDFHVKKMSALLQQVKGGGQGQAISKSEVAAAADNILGPLMDLLDGSNLLLLMIGRGKFISFCYPQDPFQCTLKTVINQFSRDFSSSSGGL